MKANKKKNTKFSLEKMKVAKLKNSHLINGGNILGDDPKTITDLLTRGGTRTE
jgi:hypothetical protein